MLLSPFDTNNIILDDFQSSNFGGQSYPGEGRSGAELLIEGELDTFQPLHTTMTVDPSSQPLFEVIQQPNAEITRNVYFDFKLKCLTSAVLQAASSPQVELIYENYSAVPGGDNVFDAQPNPVRDDILTIRARIKELSKAHRGQRFRVRISCGGASVCSNPIRVLSKTSIVNAHRSPAPSTPKPVVDVPRKRARDEDDSSVADMLKQVLRQQQEHSQLIHYLITQNAALHEEVRMLRGAGAAASVPNEPEAKRVHVSEPLLPVEEPLMSIGGSLFETMD